jgi:hypothetical protein
MTRVTAYNTFGTKESRVVASFDVDTFDVRAALTEANYRASLWNKTETRDNMRVNFVMAGGMLRPV